MTPEHEDRLDIRSPVLCSLLSHTEHPLRELAHAPALADLGGSMFSSPLVNSVHVKAEVQSV